MKNFVQPGNTLTMTAPAGGVVSGYPYSHGDLAGIASQNAAEGEPYDLDMVGVYDVPKNAAEAWAEGDKIYIDASTKVATNVASTNKYLGKATAAAANPTGTGLVRLG